MKKTLRNLKRMSAILKVSAILGMVALPQIASACPTCKDGLHADGTAAAYAVSILFMMGMPFAIITFWTVMIVRLRRQAQNSGLSSQPQCGEMI